MNNDKRIVAHIKHTFFEGSETFIYNYISHLKTYQPICLAWKFDNIKQFPFPEEDSYILSLDRHSLAWLYNRVYKRFSGIDTPLKNIFRDRAIKLIHAHFGPHGVYALNIKKMFNIPLVTSFYGYDLSNHSTIKEWKRGYEVLFREGDVFLVEGPCMKSKLTALGCPEEKIEIQRLGIPLDQIDFIPRQPKKDKEKTILVFSGRFVEKKGIIYALMATRELIKTFTNFELHLIGDGPLRQEIKEFIRTNNMDHYVKLSGFLSYSDYLKEMQHGDIFVHPSITASDGETEGGAPMVILEAQAMGMPVASTLHADIPNIVVPGKSALLSEEGDYTTLAENIAYLLKNQEAWHEMGQAGRMFVDTYHNIEKEIEALEKKYDNVLKNAGTGE
jgi:colanic acid/amylovoran biosynthesis glycosyltransferase